MRLPRIATIPPGTPERTQLRRNLFIGTADGLLATPLVFLSVPGNLLIAALLTQSFSVDAATFGLIVSLPAWFNALQVFLVPYLSARLAPKALTLSFAWVHLFLWLVFLVALPLLPADAGKTMAWFFVAIFLAKSAAASFAGIGWTAWVQDWIPNRIRGSYFGYRNRLCSLITLAFLAVSAALVRWAPEGLLPYLLLIGATIFGRAIALAWQGQIEGGSAPHEQRTLSLRQSLAALKGQSSFWNYIVFGAAAGFLLGVAGPVVPIVLYEHLHLPVDQAVALGIFSSLTGAVGMPFWGRLIDKHGAKPVIIGSLLSWEVIGYLWMFLTPEIRWLVFPMWLWGGFTSAGFFLGTFSLLLKLVLPAFKTAAVSVHLAVTSVAAALGPVLAGLGLDALERAGADTIPWIRAGFGVKTTLLMLSVVLLSRVVEPRSGTLTDLLGGFRTVRQLLQVSGLSAIANISPVRAIRKVRRRGDDRGQG